ERNVTGVQTCALPILAEVGAGRDFDRVGAAAEQSGAGRLPYQFQFRTTTPQPRPFTHSQHGPRILLKVLQQAQLSCLALMPRGEIGRASCREGVWSER